MSRTLLLILCLAIPGCGSPDTILGDLRQDEQRQIVAKTTEAKRATAAAVKADKAVLPTAERISDRRHLLDIAILALGVVALCVVAAQWFPEEVRYFAALAAGSGVFSTLVLVLRAVVAVPDWMVFLVLGAAAVAALAIALRRGGKSHAALREAVQGGKIDAAKLSGKASLAVARIKRWFDHHQPKV